MPLGRRRLQAKQLEYMNGKHVVVIDVGSSNVVIAVGEVGDQGKVVIRGIVSTAVEGVESGRIDNSDMVSKAIVAAKRSIEEQLNITITEAYAGISGDFVRAAQITDHVYVEDDSQNSNNVTQRDVDALDKRMRSVKVSDDREMVMSSEPLKYMVDRREVKAPVGSFGKVLSAVYNFVLCDKIMRDRLINVIQRSGITVKEVVPNVHVIPLSVANSDEMQDGVVTIDLGGGVTDVTVCYGGKVRYMSSIPIGAQAINADIRSYSMPEKYVEDLKILHGCALVESAPSETITFQRGSRVIKSILSKNLATIIEARLSEIAEHVRRELRDSGYSQKLSAGGVITGGAAQTRDIEKLFSSVLGMEVRMGYPEFGITPESIELISTPAYSTAVSLMIYGAKHGECSVVERNASRNIPKPEEREPAPARETAQQQSARARGGRVNAGSISVDFDEEEPARRKEAKRPKDDRRDDRDRDFDEDEENDNGDVIEPKRGWGRKIMKGIRDLTKAFENPAEEDERSEQRNSRGKYDRGDL